MFGRTRQNDSEDIWDDDFLNDEPSSRNNLSKLVFIVVGAVLISGVILATSLLVNAQVTKRSPSRSAENWLETLLALDGNNLARETCANLPVNKQAVLQAGPLVASIFELVDIGAIPDVTQYVDYLDKIDIDASELEYATVSQDEKYAAVLVTGPAYLDISRSTFTVAMNESWDMVWEGNRWKWCGR